MPSNGLRNSLHLSQMSEVLERRRHPARHSPQRGIVRLCRSRHRRRTKATLIYKRTKNLRAVQLLLGHTKLESTVRYLGIEVDDALEISEQTEI
jgi:site-specific recombinase XerC